MSEHGEVRRAAFQDSPIPTISYGLPFPETCKKHVDFTFHANRVYIIASKTLATRTDRLKRLEAALGDKVAGRRIGMTPHTLWSECLEVTNDCRRLDADILITLGAGSLTDAAKIVSLALANAATNMDDLERLHSGTDWKARRDDVVPAQVPIISVPTTLSGGEYQDLAGGTDDRTTTKYGFAHGTRGPSLVVLDAELTTTTPDRYWLSTGVRAVDHCIETLCSLQSHDAGDEAAARGLQALVPALLRCKRNGASDIEARHICQLGVVDAMTAVRSGVNLGASHGIGHQLGTLGVAHGETSCILLPAVCWYNRSANKPLQEAVEEILRTDEIVRDVIRDSGLPPENAELDDMLDAVISALGMPRTLTAVGIGPDMLEQLAENSLQDPWCASNPIPLRQKDQVMDILEMVI